MTTNHYQTDDVGVFGSELSNEYLIAAQHFNLTREELIALSRASIGTSFASGDDKAQFVALLDRYALSSNEQ